MLDHVFVYGTLQTGGCYHHLIAPFLRRWAEGWISGALLDLGEYPGLVAGDGMVYGQSLRLQPIRRALPLLDELEEYHGPGHPGNLYRRHTVDVNTEGGTLLAWAYRYVGPREGFPTLTEGRWTRG